MTTVILTLKFHVIPTNKLLDEVDILQELIQGANIKITNTNNLKITSVDIID